MSALATHRLSEAVGTTIPWYRHLNPTWASGGGLLREGYDEQEEVRRLEHIHIDLVAAKCGWTIEHTSIWHEALNELPRGKTLDEFVGACKDATGIMGFRDLLMVAEAMDWGYSRCVYVRNMGALMATALTSGSLLSGAGTVKTRPAWGSWSANTVGTGGGRTAIVKWITPPGQRIKAGETVTIGVVAHHVNKISAVNFSWANATEQAVTSLSFQSGIGWGYFVTCAQADAGGVGYGGIRARAIPAANGVEGLLQWDGVNASTEFWHIFDDGPRDGAGVTIPHLYAGVDWATGNDATAVATHTTRAAAEAATPFKTPQKAADSGQAAMLASSWGQRDGIDLLFFSGYQVQGFDDPQGAGSPTSNQATVIPFYCQPKTGVARADAKLTQAAFILEDTSAVADNVASSIQFTTPTVPATGTCVVVRNSVPLGTINFIDHTDTVSLGNAIVALAPTKFTITHLRNIPISGAGATDSTLTAQTYNLSDTHSGVRYSTPAEVAIARDSSGWRKKLCYFYNLSFIGYIFNENVTSDLGTCIVDSCVLTHGPGATGSAYTIFNGATILLVAAAEYDRLLGWCCFYRSTINGFETHSGNTRFISACTFNNGGDIQKQDCLYNITFTGMQSILGDHPDINQFSQNTSQSNILIQGISMARTSGVSSTIGRGGQGLFFETITGATGTGVETLKNLAAINWLIVTVGQSSINQDGDHILVAHFTHTAYAGWSPAGGPSFIPYNVPASGPAAYANLSVHSSILISAQINDGGGSRPDGRDVYKYCYIHNAFSMDGTNVTNGAGELGIANYTVCYLNGQNATVAQEQDLFASSGTDWTPASGALTLNKVPTTFQYWNTDLAGYYLSVDATALASFGSYQPAPTISATNDAITVTDGGSQTLVGARAVGSTTTAIVTVGGLTGAVLVIDSVAGGGGLSVSSGAGATLIKGGASQTLSWNNTLDGSGTGTNTIISNGGDGSFSFTVNWSIGSTSVRGRGRARGRELV